MSIEATQPNTNRSIDIINKMLDREGSLAKEVAARVEEGNVPILADAITAVADRVGVELDTETTHGLATLMVRAVVAAVPIVASAVPIMVEQLADMIDKDA